MVEKETLKNAPVSAIHYSKNIILEKGLLVSSIISYLSKADIPLTLDISKSNYRNNGTSLTFHTNSYEIAFYDKIRDIAQAKISKKRSIEKYNACNMPFVKKHFLEKYGVLRIEARLNKKIIIKKLLNKIDMDVNLTFINLFNSMISQKIIQHYWRQITENIYVTFNKESYFDILINILKRKNISFKNALLSIAISVLIKEVGMGVLKSSLRKYYSLKWIKQILSTQICSLCPVNNSKNHIFTPIDMALHTFKTLQENLRELLLK